MSKKIYTRRGDDGITDLLTGERISKGDPIIKLIGELDELSSSLGIVKAYCQDKIILKSHLTELQKKLFYLSVEIAGSSANKYKNMNIKSNDVLELEKLIDLFSEKLPKLKNFILPGGSLTAAFLHQTRSICRRVERNFIFLIKADKEYNPEALKYINRLSDLLFVMARYANLLDNVQEDIISGKM